MGCCQGNRSIKSPVKQEKIIVIQEEQQFVNQKIQFGSQKPRIQTQQNIDAHKNQIKSPIQQLSNKQPLSPTIEKIQNNDMAQKSSLKQQQSDNLNNKNDQINNKKRQGIQNIIYFINQIDSDGNQTMSCKKVRDKENLNICKSKTIKNRKNKQCFSNNSNFNYQKLRKICQTYGQLQYYLSQLK